MWHADVNCCRAVDHGTHAVTSTHNPRYGDDRRRHRAPAPTVALRTTIERPRLITNGEIIFAVPIGSHAWSVSIYGVLVIISSVLIASRRIRIGVRATGAAIVICVGASRVYIEVRLASDVADRWLLGFSLGRSGTRFSSVDSRVQTLGARGSLFGVVFLAVITAFLVGAEFGP